MRKCGGCVLIVHANGHLYPTLLVGKVAEKSKINRIIRKIFPSAKGRKINYLEKEGYAPLNILGVELKGGDIEIDGSISYNFSS